MMLKGTYAVMWVVQIKDVTLLNIACFYEKNDAMKFKENLINRLKKEYSIIIEEGG